MLQGSTWAAAASAFLGAAQALTLNVGADGVNKTSPIHYGTLYEDVYHSGDGGLYAELIQNRAMQGVWLNSERNLQYWHTSGQDTLNLDNSAPALSDALPYHMRIDVAQGATGNTGFWNEGFWGINVTSAQSYSVSLYSRGTYSGDLLCAFWSNTTNSMLGNTTFDMNQQESDGWVQYKGSITPFATAPDDANTFHCDFDGSKLQGQSIRFNLISVFPETWHDRPNGMRVDLSELVTDLNPKYLRMPGGNNMEGSNGYWWQWDQTLGDLKNRPGRPGTWGYMNTDGFGLLEMMQWTLDMNVECILAVWGGLYIGGPSIAQGDLQPYIDSAMNELEFLLGDASTTYGAQRIALGYPDPFSIKYVEIGNEDFLNGGTDSYVQYRFQMFHDAVKAKYPDMKIIASLWEGYFTQGYTPPVGTIQDLHDYFSASAMVSKFNGYDNAARDYPVLVGEYATIYDDQTTGANGQLDNPTLQSATSEAVYFLGLERNADLIVGISHGALIKSVFEDNNPPNGPNDNVALLKHTATDVTPSISYYVAKLFGQHFGTETVQVDGDSSYGPLYWAGTKDDDGSYYIKIVNYGGAASTPVTVNIPGKTNDAVLKTVTAPDTFSVNLPGNITSIWKETTVKNTGSGYTFTLDSSYISAVLVV